VNTDGMTRDELVTRAFHSASDFPKLLQNVAGKNLQAAYAEEPHTWQPLGRQRNLPDFKPTTTAIIAGQMLPEETLEGGEYKAMSMVEGQTSWSLKTYTGKVLLTRQAIINDDLSAFARQQEMAGRGCRTLESNLVWGLITGNVKVSVDDTALFATGHNNSGTGAIAIAGLDTGKQKMRKQKDLAGNPLNLAPSYLLVPPDLETTAMQVLYPTGYAPSNLTGDSGTNVFANGLQLITEARLGENSASNWYLTASPSRVDMIEYGYLSSEPGPTISTSERRDPDGVEMLVRMDFGASLIDYRGFYKSSGS